jgi:hypothetical protein
MTIFVVFIRSPPSRKSPALKRSVLDSLAALLLHLGMMEPPHITPEKRSQRAAREARLAKALRENLVRRKEQKRAQDRREAAQSQPTDREREPSA